MATVQHDQVTAASWRRHIPFLEQVRGYRRDLLRDDVTAGLTVAVMLIPQGMAYAMLAGLPPIIGLYASIIPVALYAFFGTSRQLAVGPVAMVSLLVATGVGALAEPGSAEYVAYAVLLAAMVGVMQFGMGVARLGFLVRLLTHPVVVGFTSAAALIIGMSQLKHLLGVDIARSHHVHAILWSALEQITSVHGFTVAIGLASVVALVWLKRLGPRFPRALVVVALGAVAVGTLGLEAQGVAIVGDVPAGLPALGLPTVDWTVVLALLPAAISISLVGFMESISVAKAYAARNGYELDGSQELVALGLANLGAAAFGAYPVTGGFSRTAVNAQAGARTGVAGLVTAGVIAAALVFLTSWFYFLPKAVLAAIIITAVFGLIDHREMRRLYRENRTDFALLSITFLATLSLGIEAGIVIGVGASLAWRIMPALSESRARIGVAISRRSAIRR